MGWCQCGSRSAFRATCRARLVGDADDVVMVELSAPEGDDARVVAARLRRLSLRRRRSYAMASAVIDRVVVVLVGRNGAGKTNLIEAVSLFAAGRGLRRARLEDLPMVGGDGSFAVVADIDGALG